ncbi:MAG: LamG domain-containing protein, partial [Candidatus Omnitrophica bacterium]|nr:LamG domain-containing protein [Candidatus Omnitrophota bacterium]
MKRRIFLGLIWCLGPRILLPEGKPVIEERLNQARKIYQEKLNLISSLEKDLIFLANFELPGIVYFPPNRFVRVPLAESHYRPGRYGQGYYFEKPGHNLLPEEVADAEKTAKCFRATGGAALTLVTAGSPVGKKCLSITCPAAGTGLITGAWPVAWKSRSWHEKEWTLLASCYVKGPAGSKARLEVSFLEKELVLNPPKKGEPDPPPRIPDKTGPQEVTLTGEWQRIASWVSGDSRLREREAVITLTYLDFSSATLLVDGFQLEQVRNYPHHHLMPTTWLPGGQSRSATFVNIGTPLKEIFPVEEGTISFWTMTPKESNLSQPGGLSWVSFGSGWRPHWAMSDYRFMAGGEGFCYFNRTNVGDGHWHHVALGWDREKAWAYLDGENKFTFDRKRADLSAFLEAYVFRLGGGITDGQAANSVMDEVAIFRRNLRPEEIKSLAQGISLGLSSQVLLSLEGRAVFYRDEKKEELVVGVIDTGRQFTRLRLDLSLDGLVYDTQSVSLRDGSGAAKFSFSPEKLRAGRYRCRLGIKEGQLTTYLEEEIEVVAPLRLEHFLLSSWGAGGSTAEWRNFFQTLGFNGLDTYDVNVERLGKEGFIYGWHYNFGNGLWSPEQRVKVREEARIEIEKRKAYPNWKYTLVNSEKAPWPIPEERERISWFDAWAKKELGFFIPEQGWQLGTTTNPISCWFLAEEKPGSDGIYRESRPFTFLKWWYNRGCGWWRLNAEVAAEIKKVRPDVKIWTDPLHYPGQIADLDAGSTWSYSIFPEPLIGNLEEASAIIRGSGKEFYTTLGMNYVDSVATITGDDGKKKTLAPTADDLIQQAWIAVTHFPSHGLHYWCVDGVFYGEKNEKDWYAEPKTAERLGTVWKGNLLPLATMLRGVSNAPRKLALLLPESTLWFDAGEGKWWWGTAHYPNHWKKWVGKMGLPYDIVKDNNIQPGVFQQYRAVIFPMAEYVKENVYRELVLAGETGTKIIVDSYCRQTYPGMENWQQEYFYRMAADKRKDYGKTTEEKLRQLKEQ